MGRLSRQGVSSQTRPETRRVARQTAAEARSRLVDRQSALTADWAKRTGLSAGIPVAVGAFDAHLARSVGRETRHAREDHRHEHLRHQVARTPRSSPTSRALRHRGRQRCSRDYFGIEAGQSAVGDMFNWLVNYIQPGGTKAGSHERTLTGAAKLAARRKRFARARLEQRQSHHPRGSAAHRLARIGQTLYTTPAEVYRALIEATAFGALDDHQRFEEYGVKISSVVNCGGIARRTRWSCRFTRTSRDAR